MQTFTHQMKRPERSTQPRIASYDSHDGLHSDTGKSNCWASGAQLARFDFSRIRILAKTPMSRRGDEQEQEADRVAAAVMGGSETAVAAPSASSDLGVQRRLGGEPIGPAEVPPNVYGALLSPSQPLDPDARRFMEGRFGYDFSHVRVHANSEAAEAARSAAAQAYTVGSQIVFGAGEYQPNSPSGRQLIAHELAHVLQQRSGEQVVRRRILYPKPAKTRNLDLIQTYLNRDGPTLAETVLTVNRTVSPNGQAILDALTPAEIGSQHSPAPPARGSDSGSGSGSGSGASVEPGSGSGSGSGAGGATQQCGFQNFDVEISANITMPAPPVDGKWTKQVERRDIGRTDLPRECRDKDQINVLMKGKPDSAAFYQWMENNEDEHARDLTTASERFLKPYHEAVLTIQGSGADKRACEADRDQKFRRRPTDPIGLFLAQQAADVQCHDQPGRPSAECPFPGGHGTLHEPFTQRHDCDNLEIRLGQTPPAPAGGH